MVLQAAGSFGTVDSIFKVCLEQGADIWHGKCVGGLSSQSGSRVNGAANGATTDSGISIGVGGIGVRSGGPGEGGRWRRAGCGTLEATYRRLRLPLDVQLVLCPHSIKCVADMIPASSRDEGKEGKEQKGKIPEAGR
jgi:hypothetical protein